MESVSFDGYTYETQRVAVPGGSVVTYSIGTGPETLLVLHGGPGLPCDYVRDSHARLAGDRYRVVSYDQLGCGASDHPDDVTLWTIERAVQELEAVRKALDLGPVHLLGQSWGAFVAIEYALTGPNGLKTLIAEGGVANIPHLVHEWERLRSALGPETVAMLETHEALGNYSHPAYQGAITVLAYRHICRLDPYPPALLRSIAGQNAVIFQTVQGHAELGAWTGNLKHWNRLDDLHRIAQPALLLSGHHDAATPACSRLMHERLPDSRIHIFPNSSHTPFLEEPEAYFAVLKAFLDEKSAAKL